MLKSQGTFKHIWFLPAHRQKLKSQNSNLCTGSDRHYDNNPNILFIYKQDRRKRKSNFTDSFQNDMNRIKEVLLERDVK